MNIKEARLFAGLTQAQVEEQFSIPVRSLQNWEAGVRQPPEYVEEYLIQKLCQLKQTARIKVSPEDLEVRVETLMDDDWELAISAPIKDNCIPVSVLLTIGRLSEAGYKLIFI